MSQYDALLGTISQDGQPVELGNGLNFIGCTAVRNASTGMIDITVTGGGGGGGGHTIQDAGASLPQRAVLNFIGFTLSDTGGKSTVALPLINAATGLTGVAPIANGGTGLSAVGAANTVLTGNGTVWAMAQIQNAHVSATAAIAYSKLASGTAGRWLTIDASGAVIESDTALASKTVQQSSADATGGGVTARKSRGTSASPSNVSTDDPVYYKGTLRLGGAWVDVGEVRWRTDANGYVWRDVYHYDGVLYRLVSAECEVTIASSGDGDATAFTLPIAADEQMSAYFKVRGVGPSHKQVWREHYVTHRRVDTAAPTKLAETFIVPLNNTDDTDWDISYAIVSNDLLLKHNGETSTVISWKWRVRVERD